MSVHIYIYNVFIKCMYSIRIYIYIPINGGMTIPQYGCIIICPCHIRFLLSTKPA